VASSAAFLSVAAPRVFFLGQWEQSPVCVSAAFTLWCRPFRKCRAESRCHLAQVTSAWHSLLFDALDVVQSVVLAPCQSVRWIT